MSFFICENLHKPKSNVIRVHPLPPKITTCNYDFVKKFGKLRFIGLDENDDDDYPNTGFFEFEKDDSIAEQLIRKGHMEFEDKKLEVKLYKEFEHCSDEAVEVVEVVNKTEALSLPPKSDSKNNIMKALNDDCLREIFKNVHFSTLSNSILNVCVRFNCVAKEAFSSKYKWQMINLLHLDWNRKPTLSQVESFLSNFGPFMSSALVSRDAHLILVNKYCMNIKKLELDCSDSRNGTLNICHQTFYQIDQLLEKLKTLRIVNIMSARILDLISVCTELEVLHLIFMQYDAFDETVIYPRCLFPKLIEVRIVFINWELFNDADFLTATSQLLNYSPNLKILEIPRLHESINLSNNKKLNELYVRNIRHFERDLITSIHKTSSAQIKSLALLLNNVTVDSDLIQSINYDMKKTVTALEFFNCIAFNPFNSDFIENFSSLLRKLPNIKRLYFFGDRHTHFKAIDKMIMIKTILQNANQLTNLIFQIHYEEGDLFQKYPFDETDYNEIVDFLNKCNYATKLTIEFVFYVDTSDEYNCSSIQFMNMVPNLLKVKQHSVVF